MIIKALLGKGQGGSDKETSGKAEKIAKAFERKVKEGTGSEGTDSMCLITSTAGGIDGLERTLNSMLSVWTRKTNQ